MQDPSRNSGTAADKSRTTGSQIFVLLVWTALSIAMIVLGSIYIDKCAIQPKIPIYLIVAGAVHLVGFLLLPLKVVAEKVMYFVEGVMGLFSLCWFITGSVWVFSIYQTNPRDCNDTVYKFAFGILIFEYIFIAFIFVMVCLCTCCIGCLTTSGDTERARLSNNEP
ncbi:transmembrane protein 272-like [Pseudophryne corroboree]|uniref:transmembrane protein 272-like n=1 Tax=Pseudophryne corroboree TaxID=495146 RepID=UPI00308151B9